MQTFPVKFGRDVLPKLATAPDGQLSKPFRDRCGEYSKTDHTALEYWDFFMQLKKDVEFNDGASKFVHILIDLERFYLKPTE